MTTTIQKWGNSQGIRIPKILLDAVHWGEDEEIVIQAEEGRLVLTKAQGHKTIQELFEGFHGSYESCEVDWGVPAGEEVW